MRSLETSDTCGTARCVFGVLAGLLLIASSAHAVRVKNLCEVQGARGNALKGIGIVVGLSGTGDKSADAIRAQDQVLRRMGVDIENRKDLSSKNVAIVAITAVIPPFAKEGTRIDVTVSSMYDAKSLEGGTLLETLLTGIDGNAYAAAQGPLSIGGFNADAGGGNATRKNHVTVGRIPMGAYVEREIPSTITDGERIMLLLKQPDFGTAEKLQAAINKSYGPGTAAALGAGTVNVLVPGPRRTNLVSFIADVENLDVTPDVRARVVINERTGTLVVGGEVMVRPCQVAHGGLTIKVTAEPQVSQPSALSKGGKTVTVEKKTAEAEEEPGHVLPLSGTSAAQVAEGLNKLKVTPRDMITIFQALREAGVIDADLEII